MPVNPRNALLGAGLATLAMAVASQALAQQRHFDIPEQDAATAVTAFALQADLQISAPTGQLRGVKASAVRGDMDARAALQILLQGTGLVVARDDGRTIALQMPPQGGSAAGDGAEVEALIVTAQKREEDIQDVPIAISAFTQQALEAQKIEGGFDLLKAIPNVTFSKNNFSSYNFSIRGIGTKAVSVTTDPGVAVAFNSTALIRNRLFEQEYFDVERVEVLRGPQGTLYGRNATAGVINVISAKPQFGDFNGSIKGEVGNYNAKRLQAMVNLPLAGETLALRLAGSMTSRDGYDFNATTGNAVNGRDLWSARATLGFRPTEMLDINLVWERFEEDDNRSRTGKQLCHRDSGPETLGALANLHPLAQGALSQGCRAGSLYDDASFGTPNGLSIPFIIFSAMHPIGYVVNPVLPGGQLDPDLPNDPDNAATIIEPTDPYGGMMQSRDLRTIASIKDPRYRARADVIELNINYEVAPGLTLVSQTAYNKDKYYSFQDFNRYNTVPIFNDSTHAYNFSYGPVPGEDYEGYYNFDLPDNVKYVTPGGIFDDPQIGPSNSLAGFDISRAESEQFSQEFRLQSDLDGPLNFSVGANYTRYKTLEDYFVMYNLITITAYTQFMGVTDMNDCDLASLGLPLPPGRGCVYVDPNPVESINGEGHNYFRSKNPYKLSSAAAFGEVYWTPSDALKITAGLRYTDDHKTFTPVPSQVLLSTAPLIGGGLADKGYPANPDIKQHWGEVTGRLGVDWKPDLAFTDQTMLYAFYSRGYKGGGANPPAIGFDPTPFYPGGPPLLQALPFPETFKPEFVNAFEAGAKNVLLGGALVLNGTAFLYDYTDYQISRIVDRSAANENFDAKVWGGELEAVFSPTRDLRLNSSLGYMQTKLDGGQYSLDAMDRLQGHDDFVVVKPWVQLTSNCVIRKSVIEDYIAANRAAGILDYGGLLQQCPGSLFTLSHLTEADLPNQGQGFFADVGGNELPNAPHWTVSMGAQYGWEFLDGWRATARGDAYWQSQSWARVYNAVNDKLHGWYNVNLSLWIERPQDDLRIELYAKNLLDKTPITDAFLNSDDTALTTNVFVLDPRLIGLSIRKGF